MIARTSPVWLLPLGALLLIWPLAEGGANRTLFLAMNGVAAGLPAVLWSCLTVLGDGLVGLCLLLPFLRRRPDLVLAALWAALPAFVVSHGLKTGLALARPVAELGAQVHVIGPYLHAGSFPSGHTTAAFVLASVLALGLRERRAVPAVLALAVLAGLSRIAVGAHWPLDVAGGVLCGWLSGMLGLYLAGRFGGADHPAVLALVRLVLVGAALLLLLGHDSHYPLARPFEQALALAVLAHHLRPGWSLAGARAPT
jgi:membrane-associated phospholipid phosphatase